MRHYANSVVTASTESVHSSSSSAAAAASKPPRAPVNSKSPYMNSSASNTGGGVQHAHNHTMHGRSNTPPRRPQDPGAKIDSNFVTDNWDEDEEDESGAHRGGRRVAGKSNSGGGGSAQHRAEDKAVAGRDQYGNAVKQDENWLEENFDDD